MAQPSFSLGLDFGTGSLRALIVDTSDGSEVATAVFEFPTGDQGVLTDPADPNVARQHPADYLAGIESVIGEAVGRAASHPGFDSSRIVGIGVDSTGSTPIPVDNEGVPLALHSEFENDLGAMAWLWKDHTAHAEAAEITETAMRHEYPYLSTCGGRYSSEWYWAKILKCERSHPRVAAAAAGWIELCDYVPGYLSGASSVAQYARGICAAGHKAMYHERWGGLPSSEFLDRFSPSLDRHRYSARAVPADRMAGRLTPSAAADLGLVPGIPIAVGAFDAHMGAVGAGCGVGTLVKIMGTSTCDCAVLPSLSSSAEIPGVCGVVPGSIIPEMIGVEAGQSAVGDIFDWFVRRIAPSGFGSGAEMHRRLSAAAADLRPGQSGLLALDWHNGNRTVLTDPLLTGLVIGEHLQTTPAEIYRALIEATAFGALRIIDQLERHGVTVQRIVNCGGIAEKNPLVMQIYADVTGRPMHLSRSSQTCALGAAIFGAVVGGAQCSVKAAQAAMTSLQEKVFHPTPDNREIYARLYRIYQALHDAFGQPNHGGSLHWVMKELIDIRQSVRSAA